MAEVFGAEMVLGRVYSFSGTQQAIFSWSGCTLEVRGTTGHSYIASETPMASYLQVHGELDMRRHAAHAAGTDGPRVLVCGPADTGKSSLSRLLCGAKTRLTQNLNNTNNLKQLFGRPILRNWSIGVQKNIYAILKFE